MELRQLAYFVAVVDSGGLRKAGIELRVTPSAISRAIGQLEHALGAELLERTPVGVVLTDVGREFLDHARSVLQAADRAAAVVRSHSSRPKFRVGLISGQFAAGELTKPILRRAQMALPGVGLEAKVLTVFEDQVRAVLAGWVDVAIVRAPLHQPDLELTPLAQESRVLLVPEGSELADCDYLDVDDFRDVQIAAFGGPAEWAHHWQLDDVRPANYVPNCGPVRTLQEMQTAATTHGAAVVAGDVVSRMTATPGTRCVPIHDIPESTIVVARRRADRRPEVEQFVNSALATVNECIDLVPGLTIPAAS